MQFQQHSDAKSRELHGKRSARNVRQNIDNELQQAGCIPLTKPAPACYLDAVATATRSFARFNGAIMVQAAYKLYRLPHPRPRVHRVTASDILAITHGRSVPKFWRRAD